MIRLLLILTLFSSSYQVYGKCAPSSYYSGELKVIKDKLSKSSSSALHSKDKVLLLNLLEHVNAHGAVSKNHGYPEIRFKINRELKDSGDKAIFAMDLRDFKHSILQMMSNAVDWNKLRSSGGNKDFLTDEAKYLSAIGESNYLKAIFYTSINKDDKTKKALLEEFESEYNRAINVSQTRNSICGGTPQFYWFDKIYKSLEALADGDELDEVKKKYKKAQLHISNVPRSRILT